MAILKKIGVFSAAKIQAIMMAVIGLIFGILGMFITGLRSAGMFGGFGFLGILLLPIVYAIIGFISGAFGAWIYNLVSGWIGGVELELD